MCVARDVRGAAFFPLQAPPAFIYAVALTRATSTFHAQQDAEQAATGSSLMVSDRYPYDPEENDADKQSAIWQFQEYAAHRILPEEIVACYEIEQQLLMDDQGSAVYAEKLPMAGIRFKLSHVWQRSSPSRATAPVITKANAIADQYDDFYPSDEMTFLSYYGFVKDMAPHNQPQTMAQVTNKFVARELEQLSGVAGPSTEALYDAGLTSKEKDKGHSKSRRQKKSKR